jgi:hypothetical protein
VTDFRAAQNWGELIDVQLDAREAKIGGEGLAAESIGLRSEQSALVALDPG